MPQCEQCALRRRCQWDGRDYLSRGFGTAGLEAVKYAPERHVRDFDPQHPGEVMGALVFERDEVRVAVRSPGPPSR